MYTTTSETPANGEFQRMHLDIEAQHPLRPHDGGEAIRERLEKTRHLQKEAFQLANYYFVFQGVIFTAFYNTQSHVKCEYRWIPFALSFLAGFINVCSLLGIACTYKTTLVDIDREATRPRGPHAPPNALDPVAVRCARNWRLVCIGFSMILITTFFVITLVGCLTITCASNAAAPPSPAAA